MRKSFALSRFVLMLGIAVCVLSAVCLAQVMFAPAAGTPSTTPVIPPPLPPPSGQPYLSATPAAPSPQQQPQLYPPHPSSGVISPPGPPQPYPSLPPTTPPSWPGPQPIPVLPTSNHDRTPSYVPPSGNYGPAPYATSAPGYSPVDANEGLRCQYAALMDQYGRLLSQDLT